MANEAITIELGINAGSPVRRTCADTSAFEKGALVFLVDPNTASGANIAPATFGGIVNTEKVALDGSTTIGVNTSGVYDLVLGGTCNIGDALVLSGANVVKKLTDATGISGSNFGQIVGMAEETGIHAEVIRVKLRGF